MEGISRLFQISCCTRKIRRRSRGKTSNKNTHTQKRKQNDNNVRQHISLSFTLGAILWERERDEMVVLASTKVCFRDAWAFACAPKSFFFQFIWWWWYWWWCFWVANEITCHGMILVRRKKNYTLTHYKLWWFVAYAHRKLFTMLKFW